MIHVEYSQVMVVCISVLVLESVEFCLKKVTTFLQGLFGGKRYRRVMEIKDKIRELEKEKNEYHSVDQFPKIAKIERYNTPWIGYTVEKKVAIFGQIWSNFGLKKVLFSL